jgi:hypothetical protein
VVSASGGANMLLKKFEKKRKTLEDGGPFRSEALSAARPSPQRGPFRSEALRPSIVSSLDPAWRVLFLFVCCLLVVCDFPLFCRFEAKCCTSSLLVKSCHKTSTHMAGVHLRAPYLLSSVSLCGLIQVFCHTDQYKLSHSTQSLLHPLSFSAQADPSDAPLPAASSWLLRPATRAAPLRYDFDFVLLLTIRACPLPLTRISASLLHSNRLVAVPQKSRHRRRRSNPQPRGSSGTRPRKGRSW